MWSCLQNDACITLSCGTLAGALWSLCFASTITGPFWKDEDTFLPKLLEREGSTLQYRVRYSSAAAGAAAGAGRPETVQILAEHRRASGVDLRERELRP